ncbi:hypothetical protein [Eubacterium limosum]|uniref:DUF7657 domain-containing protein n=1 Tax=Eubacterium limosum TaxID=1736 RepID=UPI00371F8916
MFFEFKNYVGVNKKKIILILFFSLIISFFCVKLLNYGFFSWEQLLSMDFSRIFFSRFLLLFIICLFIGIHWLFPVSKLYQWIFSYRYWIALVILIFMAVNQYNSSSIAMFDQYIQKGQGSEYVEPILGTPRAIRSDEWLVGTPDRLSAQYGDNAYSQYNYILRATKTPNIANGNMYFNYSSLANPFTIAIFLFGQSYGQSVLWYGVIILTFLVSIEMCMIISKKNKLVSVMGATIIVFSGYYQWWLPVTWILGSQASIVCGYHFINTKKRSFRVLLGIGLGISLAYFITILYPAWQVPVSYLFLGILIWIIWENKNRIKQLDKCDWFILICSIIFAISLVIAYLIANVDYVNGITTTVYPGNRVSTGGGGAYKKLFWWFYNPLFVMPGKNFANPSEAGAFMSFFPIPLLLSLWYLVKERQKDLFTIMLLIVTFFLGTYVVVGWPEILAKVTLMSYSPSARAVDVLMFTQVYLLISVLSRFKESKKIPKLLFGGVIGATLPIYIVFNIEQFPEVGIPMKSIVFLSCFFCIITTGIVFRFSKNTKNKIIILLTIFAFLTGAFVHPIQKGFDAIYSKPVAKQIEIITKENPEDKWMAIANNLVYQQFLVACGAPTINSVNIMPNLELWKKLDPNGIYNDVYNRYAHVVIELTDKETWFELVQADYFIIHLSYKDIPLTGVSFIYSDKVLNSNEYVEFENLYNENGSYLYKVL